MDFYVASLMALILANGALAYQNAVDRSGGRSGKGTERERDNGVASLRRSVGNITKLFGGLRGGHEISLKYIFLPVYVLVMASDWLQVRRIYLQAQLLRI